MNYAVPGNAVMLSMLFLYHVLSYLFIKFCAYLRDHCFCKINKNLIKNQ